MKLPIHFFSVFLLLFGFSSFAAADKLDDIIKSGTLNCGVVLDFPPMGYFDKNNQAAGFDVDYCKDLAKILKVKVNIINLTWADRIPSLISGKTDLVIGSTSDTMERAKSVAFSYPYFVFKFQVFHRRDTRITSFDSLKNFKVGTPVGTTYETEYFKFLDANGLNKSKHVAFKSENDAFLGLYQGKVDAIITANTNIATKLTTPEFKDYVAGPFVPNYDDVVGIIVKRNELAWLNYINLFLVHQIRDGALNALHMKHFGTPVSASMVQALRDNK